MLDLYGIQLPFNVNDLLSTSNDLIKVFGPWIILGIIFQFSFLIQLFITKALLMNNQETKKSTRKRSSSGKTSSKRTSNKTPTNRKSTSTTRRSSTTTQKRKSSRSNLKVV